MGDNSMQCLRCSADLVFLKEYKFESQDRNRGVFGALFDVEEHLVFNVYVCSGCRHTEFFFTGSSRGLDEWID